VPVYEYECQDCGNQVTIIRLLSDTSPPICSACDSKKLTRLISQVAVVKSSKQRATDVSWIDKDLAGRLKKKAKGKLSPAFKETLNRMESQ
jgi:putative FmdB family regulatory protein